MVLRHNCGLCVAHTLHDAYSFIKSLQHRGREATGIAAIANDRIDVIKWKGPVTRFDVIDLHKIFHSHDYHTFMAHVRYATKGRKDRILEDAHPHTIGGRVVDRGNHILILGAEMAAIHNGQVNQEYLKDADVSCGCDTAALLHLYRKKGEYEILRNIPGAYTIAIADTRKNHVAVLRDKSGIKPGCLGLKDRQYCIASEDIALKKNGGEFIEDLEAGCIYYLSADGGCVHEKAAEPAIRHCFFEYNYLAHLDSIIDGVSVRLVRQKLGKILADEFNPEDADLVTFLPRCPETAARVYKKEINRKLVPVFYKMHSERSFQGSTGHERRASIDQNLHLIPGLDLEGKTIISIDDSTVRGNNSKRARELLYEKARVKKCYHVNYTPPIGIIGKDGVARGCLFGVDMPPDDDFIARGRSLDEISEAMQMPTVYISVEGMLRAYEGLGLSRNNLCTYCIGGKHPFG